MLLVSTRPFVDKKGFAVTKLQPCPVQTNVNEPYQQTEKAFEFDASISGGETPVNGRCRSPGLPSCDFLQGVLVRDANCRCRTLSSISAILSCQFGKAAGFSRREPEASLCVFKLSKDDRVCLWAKSTMVRVTLTCATCAVRKGERGCWCRCVHTRSHIWPLHPSRRPSPIPKIPP